MPPVVLMIQLRAMEPEDLELLYTIENDPDMWDVGASATPYSHYALRQHIRSMGTDLAEGGEARWVIALASEGATPSTPIGLLDLTHYDARSQRAEVSIALLREYRHQGFALEALRQLTSLSRRYFHLHQVYALVDAENADSARLFESAGYTLIATLPEWHFANGSYQNMLLYQLFI